MTQIIAVTRGRVRSGLATWSFIFAQIGGILAMFSPLGAPVRAFAGLFSLWFAPILFVALVIVCLGDWAEDSIPNRRAVYTAMAWPSALYAAFDGPFGDKIFSAVRWVGRQSGGWGANWQAKADAFFHVSGEAKTAFTAFGVMLFTAAVVYAQRYARSSKKGASGGAVGGNRS
jgi:hypothetical protein